MPTEINPNNSRDEEYLFSEPIGEGAFGEVFLSESRTKAVKKQSLDTSAVKEVYLLKILEHPSILPVEKVYCSDSDLYIEMPIASGLDKLRTEQLPNFFEDMLEVLRYLHSHNICHRDICNDNILYNQEEDKPYLIDLGTADFNEKSLANYCHINFAAPESLIKKAIYNSKAADIWSLGRVFLDQISDYESPLNMTRESFYYYYKGRFSFGLKGAGLSFTANKYRPMVQDMLQFDPKKRLTVEQLLAKYFPHHRPHLHKVVFDKEIMDILNIDIWEQMEDDVFVCLEQVLKKLKIKKREEPKFTDLKSSHLRQMAKKVNCKAEAINTIEFFFQLVEETNDLTMRHDLIVEFFETVVVDHMLKFFDINQGRIYFNEVFNKCTKLLFEDDQRIKEIMPRCQKKVVQALTRFEVMESFTKHVCYYASLKQIPN